MNTSSKAPLPVVLILLLIAVSGTLGLCLLQLEGSRPVELRVMCFNIRNGYGKDGDNRWDKRKELVAKVIGTNSYDVIGLQEAFGFQLAYLLEQLPAYRAVGEGRDGGNKGEHCPILYRADRFRLIDSGTFWLSETPEIPSTHWGNRYRRICTWAKLEDRLTGRLFSLYNTHFDHRSENSRRKSAQLIMDTIAQHTPDEPFVFCGDFNALEGSPVVNYLTGRKPLAEANPLPLIDTWRRVHPLKLNSGTVSRFNGCRIPCKIDTIFVRPQDEVIGAEVVRFHQNRRHPSDHYPVNALLRLK